MAATNPGELDNLDLGPGADLNLDDDSLFAELDSEVMAGGEGDLDLDLGDDASAGADGDIDLDLGSDVSAAGGDADLDLDLGDDAGAMAGGDDLDLGDLGGGDTGDDLDLDLGGDDSGAADMDLDLDAGVGDDLDLDLGGDDAGAGEMDLDLAAGGAGDDLDLDLGGDDAGAADMDLDLGGDDMDLDLDAGLGEAAAPADDAMDLGLDEDEALSADTDEIDLGDLGADDASGMDEVVAEDMEALDLDVGEAGLDELDMGAVDLGLEDSEPEPEPFAEPELAADDLGMEEISVESADVPDEPVFDMAAMPEQPAAEAESEFHAADDIQLDEEPLHLELDEVEMEPIEEPATDDLGGGGFDANMGAFDLTEEAAGAPAMAAMDAMHFEPVPEPEEGDLEFSAVQDMHVDDDTLLELNLDDVEQIPAEDDAFMAQPHAQAASAMEDTIPLTEQLEIPPVSQRQSARAGAVADTARAGASAGSMLNNEILMAVSHQISVQLGALELNGKELLDIGYGSVLPLDRMIGEPVDLVLDNKTIAQAEVVLINGKNLGVRIVALNR